MLNLIGQIWDTLTGAAKKLLAPVFSLINAIESNVEKGFDELYSDLVGLGDALSKYEKAVGNFIVSEFNSAITYAAKIVTDLQNWTVKSLTDLGNDIKSVISWATQQLDNLAHAIENGLNSLKNWVINSVYNPIRNDLDGAIAWIEKEGVYAYNLVTHPQLMSEVLGDFALQSWLFLFKRYASPVTSLIVSQFRKIPAEVASVLEDILDNVL